MIPIEIYSPPPSYLSIVATGEHLGFITLVGSKFRAVRKRKINIMAIYQATPTDYHLSLAADSFSLDLSNAGLHLIYV